jgi:hypothetical protein
MAEMKQLTFEGDTVSKKILKELRHASITPMSRLSDGQYAQDCALAYIKHFAVGAQKRMKRFQQTHPEKTKKQKTKEKKQTSLTIL